MKKIVISISLIIITLISILLISNILFAQPYGYSVKPTITGSGGKITPPEWSLYSPNFVDGLAESGVNGYRFRVISESIGIHGGGIALDSSDEFGSLMTLELLAPEASVASGSLYKFTQTFNLGFNLENLAFMIFGPTISLTDGTGNLATVENIQVSGINVGYALSTIGYRAFNDVNYFTNKLYIGPTNQTPISNAELFIYDGDTEINGNNRSHSFKNHSGYTTSFEYKTSEASQTTNASPQQTISWGLTAQESCEIEARVSAKTDGTNSNRAGYYIIGHIYHNGTIAVIQGQTAVSTIESSAAWDAVLSVSGTAFGITVTGAAGTTINWVTYFTFHCVNDDA